MLSVLKVFSAPTPTVEYTQMTSRDRNTYIEHRIGSRPYTKTQVQEFDEAFARARKDGWRIARIPESGYIFLPADAPEGTENGAFSQRSNIGAFVALPRYKTSQFWQGFERWRVWTVKILEADVNRQGSTVPIEALSNHGGRALCAVSKPFFDTYLPEWKVSY